MPSQPSRAEPIPPELLLSLLREPERPTLYVSEGFGPTPARRPGEEPEHVRAIVAPREPFAAVQAAGERWIAAAEACKAGPVAAIDAAEVADPPASSPWAAAPPERRAALLGRGIEEMLELSPRLLLFRLTPRHGGHVLGQLRDGAAAGLQLDGPLILLDHLVFAGITLWLTRERGEWLVVGPSVGSAWCVQSGFPPHAPVWRRGLACAPLQHVAGLMFANLLETVLLAALARRAGAAPPREPAIAAALRSAEATIASRVIDILAEGDRHSGPAN